MVAVAGEEAVAEVVVVAEEGAVAVVAGEGAVAEVVVVVVAVEAVAVN